MGSSASGLLGKLGLGKEQEYKVVFLGLDGAGKTALLYRLSAHEPPAAGPTVGFNVEPVHVGGVRFTCWDVGGQKRLRALWRSVAVERQFFRGAHALVFVVDAAEGSADRLATARHELHDILASIPALAGVKVLVMANKQDRDGAMGGDAVGEALGMAALNSHEWHVQPCSVAENHGVQEGLGWLAQALTRSR